jgi:glycosyltransferase involved in cell wall biosynthesis
MSDGGVLKVAHFTRKPFPNNFSIEIVFAEVRKHFGPDISCTKVISQFYSKGLWRRLANLVHAVLNRKDVNHITGDVHYLAYLLPKKRTILTIHDCVLLSEPRSLKWWVIWLLWYWLPEKRCSTITVISESTRQQLLALLQCSPRKIRVIYDPVPASYGPSPRRFNKEKPRILQIGTGKNKNLVRVAQALKGVTCELRIIGVLSEDLIMELKANEIEFSSDSHLSDQRVREEYERCDLVVFVSLYEGFGLPIIEANAIGRPVVTSRLYSMPEVAGDAALLVDPGSVESIREGILRLIQDDGYRDSLVQAGLKNVERFKPERIAAEYSQLYWSVSHSSP